MQRPRATEFKTDFARPAALPSASLFQRAQANPQLNVDSETFLANIEEEWNKNVDAHVETLADGMVDLVAMASIENKDRYRVAQEAYQAECRAESMVLAASSLLSITHSLKLLFLLMDESEITHRREEELDRLSKDIDNAKQNAIKVWDEIAGVTRTAPEGSMDIDPAGRGS
ncbi:hypothetical protein BOTBODRAFT_158833 [Botryobasidium botryosum FD-172 SS1]|uniref:Mediator of RNA polymerase II transcription subunit 22 n=1 Tax=Botryobasidium botryosum (strain FD-172 SS1) TaxID=930990 RepID=A0A067MJF0_BOTB1|nr:hypothetical protein BOTBODRAFT_158833 [Botryobasidium botryosum FD-172 SS1]